MLFLLQIESVSRNVHNFQCGKLRLIMILIFVLIFVLILWIKKRKTATEYEEQVIQAEEEVSCVIIKANIA